MGLKTRNYTIEESGLTIPEAYAIIKNLSVKGEDAYVEMVVQTSRENALNLAPLQTVKFNCRVNRNENPFVTAYNFSKRKFEKHLPNEEVREEYNPFYGWDDDIAELEGAT